MSRFLDRKNEPLVEEGGHLLYFRFFSSDYWLWHIPQHPVSWIGREVPPGNLGLINHGGLPKILTRPGRYPGFPLRNWWAREWCGTQGRKCRFVDFNYTT